MDLFEQELKKQKPLTPEDYQFAAEWGVSADTILQTRAQAKWVLSMDELNNSNINLGGLIPPGAMMLPTEKPDPGLPPQEYVEKYFALKPYPGPTSSL